MIINAKKWLLLSVFQLNKPLFLFQCNHKSLQGFIWTCVDVDGGNYKPSGVGWFDFMWVSAVGPEYEQPVKQRLDVGDHVFVFRVDLQQASLFLPTQSKQSVLTLTVWQERRFSLWCQYSRTYLYIPVLVEIVDACNAATVAVWIVNMADVASSVTWITSDHSLKTQQFQELFKFMKIRKTSSTYKFEKLTIILINQKMFNNMELLGHVFKAHPIQPIHCIVLLLQLSVSGPEVGVFPLFFSKQHGKMWQELCGCFQLRNDLQTDYPFLNNGPNTGIAPAWCPSVADCEVGQSCFLWGLGRDRIVWKLLGQWAFQVRGNGRSCVF